MQGWRWTFKARKRWPGGHGKMGALSGAYFCFVPWVSAAELVVQCFQSNGSVETIWQKLFIYPNFVKCYLKFPFFLMTHQTVSTSLHFLNMLSSFLVTPGQSLSPLQHGFQNLTLALGVHQEIRKTCLRLQFHLIPIVYIKYCLYAIFLSKWLRNLRIWFIDFIYERMESCAFLLALWLMWEMMCRAIEWRIISTSQAFSDEG